MTGDMRDPGHGVSRIRQRPVGQRLSSARRLTWWTGVSALPPPPDIPTGPSPPVRRVATVVASIAAARRHRSCLTQPE